jgi:quinoprotein relay system zinc metallohydrolase 2
MPVTRAVPFKTMGMLGILGLLCSQAVADVTPKPLDVEQIAPGVYVHQGTTVGFDQPDSDDIANIGFIVGERCVAVIDSGGSQRVGNGLRATLEATTPVPVCYLINTHVHPDHTLGNAVFAGGEVVFVGHERLPAAFEHNRQFFFQEYADALRTPNGVAGLIPPTLLVKDTLDLDLGGRIVRLFAHGPAHTDQDLSVLDLRTGTLWLGHLFVDRVPALDGSLRGWIRLTEDLQRIEAQRVVPGNGPMPQAWPSAAEPQLRYLRTLAADVRDILDQGGFLEDALRQAGAGEQDRWALFDQHHGANVTRVYTELEWE